MLRGARAIRTEDMKRPNMAPRPPPMTPAMTVLPAQLSIAPCIYGDQRECFKRRAAWLPAEGLRRTIFTIWLPALTCPRWDSCPFREV